MQQLLCISSFLSRLVQWMIIGVVLTMVGIVGYLYVTGIRTIIPYIILSGSMMPEIPIGSVVLVQPQHIYAPGDVITFSSKQDKNTFVTHRVVSVDRGETYYGNPVYKTRGDANKSIDPETIQPEAVRGKVVLTMPYVGYAVNYVKTPKGFLIFVVIPATIIVYEELKNIKKELASLIKRFIKKHAQPHVDASAKDMQEFLLHARQELQLDPIPVLPLPVQRSKRAPFTLPLIIVLIPVLTSISFFVLQSGAFLKDAEHSIGGVIGAASSFGKEEQSVSEINADSREPLPTVELKERTTATASVDVVVSE